MPNIISRRTSLQWLAGSAATTAGLLSATGNDPAWANRKFSLDLRCGSIGVNADQRRAIALAAEYGFESVTPDAGYLAGLSDSERRELAAELSERKLRWGAAGLSVDFRNDDDRFRATIRALPQEAQALQEAGATRIGTWLSPSHAELTYVRNFHRHADRLRECCRILGDHGLRFGMEYVGPKTLWASTQHSFIHSMAETRDLIDAIGLNNVGFILDSWHWYTAHETIDDLRSLTNDDVIACDLNDAPSGIPVDEQIDSRRELPAATGVIDIKAFLTALVEIGYDGPIRAEPFNAALNALDDEPAVAATAAAMKSAFATIGG